MALPLSMVVFSALDFGVRAGYHNRLRNAAREGAALAEFSPGRVSGCPAGIDDIEGRIRKQDPDLVELPNFGFRVTTHSGGVALPMTCDLDAPPVAPGTKVAVEVFVDHDPSSPLSDAFLDPTVTARAVVVVQG